MSLLPFLPLLFVVAVAYNFRRMPAEGCFTPPTTTTTMTTMTRKLRRRLGSDSDAGAWDSDKIGEDAADACGEEEEEEEESRAKQALIIYCLCVL